MFANKSRESRGRFDLLLLEDGEFFLDDYSAYMCKISPKDKLKTSRRGISNGSNDVLLDLRRLASSRIKGRLKICTKSIMFEPDDISIPLTRYSFKDMTASPPQIYARGRDSSAQELGNDIFTVSCTRISEMREDGVHAPYVRREANGENGGNGSLESLFALVHTQVDKVFEHLELLWGTCRDSRSRWEERSILQPLLQNRIPAKFDNSLLVDFTETPLLRRVYYVDRILPLVQQQGCLMITTRHLYVQPAQVNNVGEPVFRCSIMDINAVHKRRYMLQQSSLEIFYKGNKKSIFLKCASRAERDQITSVLARVLREQQNKGSEFGAYGSNVEEKGAKLEIKKMTLKWQNREIDNYTYLMFLNTMADRSVNDLTQYPVFPWVLQDYNSQELDLTNPKTFRDLSKPIGALNEERLRHIRKRFDDMPRARPGKPLPEGIPPPFMYGTHYSTPGYVLFYIVRVAPEYMLCLQNGAFDAPDRMFFSVPKTWDSVLTNPADLKELIPEFYDNSSYNAGEFLSNLQDLRMGVRQNGKRVDDVELPPWATDPRDFIDKMRNALESDYVSENLHKWIDLVFGCKQKGEAAIEANNLFFHMTYEGAVDLEKVTDPRERSSIEDQIREFGQTPKQLFESSHVSRNGQKIVVPSNSAETETKPATAPPSHALPPTRKAVPPPMPIPTIDSVEKDAQNAAKVSDVNVSAKMGNAFENGSSDTPKTGKGNPFGNPFRSGPGPSAGNSTSISEAQK